MRKTLALLFAVPLFAVPALAFVAPATPVSDETAATTPSAATAACAEAGEALFTLKLDPAASSQQVNDCKGGGGGRCICQELYAPVCGCEGVTYINSCYVGCKVKSWALGACDGSGV